MTIRFYCAGQEASTSPVRQLSGGYEWELWRPSLTRVRPAGMPLFPYVMWWVMHHTLIFANPGYAIFVVYKELELVHYSGIYPGYFRFPFMAKEDLQIGNTWTHPDHRGRGLAAFAICKILELEHAPSRTIWYLTEDENSASVRAVEKAGMVPRGYGVRTKRFGLSLLGTFALTQESRASDS